MTSLADFLNARLDDAEEKARATAGSPSAMTHNPWEARPPLHGEDGWTVWSQGRFLLFGGLHEDKAVHIARNDPASVLADVRAKRQILADADKFVAEFEAGPDPYGTLGRRAHHWRDTLYRNMAGAYREHPAYLPAWTPDA